MIDPDPIPVWALRTDTAYPCPCGREIEEDFVIHEGNKEFKRIFHEGCLKLFLELKQIDDQDE